uniref:Ig-like domain-containing protein n=1 Tax=Pundamilia nyererei TaxID=303518 RepID=A0A3B4H6Q3_9CICH
ISYNINRSIIYSNTDDDTSGRKKQLGKCAPADQQKENTQSHQNERRWFSILMNWVRPNNSAPHVVEWKHKCVGKKQPDGSLQFLYSMNTIKYDGENFLIFDEKKKVWIPVTENAKQIERKLDRDEGLKEFIMGYMKNKCMDLLKVFVYCENEQQTKPPPEVHVFAKNSSINANLILICLATGFFTKKIIMRIKRNGRVLDKDDGLKSSGVVLNSDNSFQRRDQVEILKSDVAEYSCEVILEEFNVINFFTLMSSARSAVTSSGLHVWTVVLVDLPLSSRTVSPAELWTLRLFLLLSHNFLRSIHQIYFTVF